MRRVCYTLILLAGSSPWLEGAEPVTFNKHIAPIVFQHCAPCHRPGGAGPFSLFGYGDVRKRAKEIAEVTSNRAMPPWLPEAGFGEFLGERRLSADQIEIIREWISNGAVEGAATDLPPIPKWAEGWQLGQPDLVLQMSPPYTLGPEGKDLYRNFVIPVPSAERRYVQAVEFRPSNRSVHHVNVFIDQQGQSRLLDAEDPEPGFDGMVVPAQFPPGHLLNWVLGKYPTREPAGLPWILEPETDLVLQLHLRRTGKPELLQPSIGLYFTNKPPIRPPLVFGLFTKLIDIPPGEKNYVVERSYTLPVDVQILAVLPHLHYLGKEVQAFAMLPDGSKKWLLFIKRWNFNWQGEYRYKKPVFLPQGAILTMRHTYDNSDQNVRNPNHPPRRVVFGPQSTDEMGELWLQLLPKSPRDLAILQNEKSLMDLREARAFHENHLREHPDDALSHLELGKILGTLGEKVLAAQHFLTALKFSPNQVEANYYFGLVLLEKRRYAEARAKFDTALRANPRFYKAHYGMAMICLEENQLNDAEGHLRAALNINPKDVMVQESLARIVNAKGEAAPRR